MTKILFIGDIIGKPGRETVKKLLPSLKEEFSADLIIANGENAAGGMGINAKKYQELIDSGIEIVTLGNHAWHNKDFTREISECRNIVRPANYPPGTPGNGRIIYRGIGVINLLGRVFMKELDCPFRAVDRIIDELKGQTKIIIVDVHGEATSEKQALGWYLDGRVSAVIGTHTHVQTADERILPNGTAYITDAGMVGPNNSVIGVDTTAIIERFLTQLPKRFEVAKEGPNVFNAVVLDIDESTGKARGIKRIFRVVE
ncbi:MAG: TIGR00282 family metallophosphoesterase [Candidatus Saganbacteria bacterium]|nr:TIGR00282 family metallophosphoesterase [Candidatus Saganbacteria bacterium]